MFSRLKCLSISLSSISDFCFDRFINCHFRQLERLEAFALTLKTKNCLNLPHLKTLSLHFLRIDIKPIELHLPSLLHFLSNESVVSFHFSHPESLTHLLASNDKSIGQFVHLRYLSCHYFSNDARTNLQTFFELEEICYWNDLMESGGSTEFYFALKDLGRLDSFSLNSCGPFKLEFNQKKIWLGLWAYLPSLLSKLDLSFLQLAEQVALDRTQTETESESESESESEFEFSSARLAHAAVLSIQNLSLIKKGYVGELQ